MIRTTMAFSAFLLTSQLAFAVGPQHKEEAAHHRDHTVPPEAAMVVKPLQPATRYSGRTPVDLTNGLPMNNGTYGLPNKSYEAWAEAPTVTPNVSDKTYPYARKDAFVAGLNESASFVKSALHNWDYSINHPTEVTKPEVIEYAKASINTMKPLLEKFEKALSDANGAGKSDWDNAQTNARKALVELRGQYSQLHHNAI
jgi:hypothetical protein